MGAEWIWLQNIMMPRNPYLLGTWNLEHCPVHLSTIVKMNIYSPEGSSPYSMKLWNSCSGFSSVFTFRVPNSLMFNTTLLPTYPSLSFTTLEADLEMKEIRKVTKVENVITLGDFNYSYVDWINVL